MRVGGGGGGGSNKHCLLTFCIENYLPYVSRNNICCEYLEDGSFELLIYTFKLIDKE